MKLSRSLYLYTLEELPPAYQQIVDARGDPVTVITVATGLVSIGATVASQVRAHQLAKRAKSRARTSRQAGAWPLGFILDTAGELFEGPFNLFMPGAPGPGIDEFTVFDWGELVPSIAGIQSGFVSDFLPLLEVFRQNIFGEFTQTRQTLDTGIQGITGTLIDFILSILQTIFPQLTLARADLAKMVDILLKQFAPDLAEFTRNIGPQHIKVLSELGRILLGQGIESQTVLLAAADEQASATLESAETTAAAISTQLPTLSEWLEQFRRLVSSPTTFEELRTETFNEFLPFVSSFESLESIRQRGIGGGDAFDLTKIISVDVITPFLASVLDGVIKWVEALAGAAGKLLDAASQPVGQIMEPLFGQMLERIENIVADTGHVPPHEGFHQAKRFLTAAGEAGLQAHLTSLAFELVPWVKHLGIGQIPAFMADVAAFGPIASQTWGRAIGIAVGRATEYHLNSLMRSKIPGEGELVEMLIKRELHPEDFRRFMAFHGYLDDYVDLIERVGFRDPRLTEIIRLAQDVSVDETDVTRWVAKAGFDDEDVGRIVPVVMQQSRKAEIGRVISEVIAGLREGTLSDFEAEGIFDRLRLPFENRELILGAARLAFRREMIAKRESDLEFQVVNNLIGIIDYIAELRALGLPEEKITVLVSHVEARLGAKLLKEVDKRSEKEEREIQAARIKRFKELFGLGQINEAQFLVFLELLGLTPQLAAEIVALETVRLKADAGEGGRIAAERLQRQVVNLRRDTFVDLFREDAINETQLRANLEKLGLAAPLVDAIMEKEVLLKVKAPSVNVPKPPLTLQ